MDDDYLPWTEFSDAGYFAVKVTGKGVAVSTSTEFEDMPDDTARKLYNALTQYFADKRG